MAGGGNRPGQFGGQPMGQPPQGNGPRVNMPQRTRPPMGQPMGQGGFRPGVHWEPPFAQLQDRSLGMCILLSIVTLGIYQWVWIYKVHNELPRRSGIDDTPGLAVALLFIPIFNIYWVCRIYSRLTDRLNLLSASAGQNPNPISRGLLVAAIVLSFIPLINVIGFVLLIVWWVKVQETMNTLAAINAQRQAYAQAPMH